MRTPLLNRTMPLAFGVSLCLHAAVLVGFRLVSPTPSLPGGDGDGQPTLTLIHIPVDSPAAPDAAEPAKPAVDATQPQTPPMAAEAEPDPAPPIPQPLTPQPIPVPDKPTEVASGAPPALAMLQSPPSAIEEKVQQAVTVGPASLPAPATNGAQSTQPGAALPAAPASVTRPTTPSYRFNPEPDYPPMARRRGLEGRVLLNVMVTSQGRVAEARIAQSSGHALLDEAAEKAVRRWEFEPGRIGVFPVESEVQVPVQFKLVAP